VIKISDEELHPALSIW